MGGSPVQTRSGGPPLSVGRCYQDWPADSTLGLSHRGDLHFGQTAGRSTAPVESLERGSHSCPHRHRAPRNMTIPSSCPLSLLPFAIDRQYIRMVLTSQPCWYLLLVDSNREACHGTTTAARTRN